MFCEECQTSLCSKCATQRNHRGHIFTDLETIYVDKYSEATKPIMIGFTAGDFSKNDITYLLGKIHVPSTKAEKREISPSVSVDNTAMKPAQKQIKEDRKKPEKKLMSLSATVTKVREFYVPGVQSVNHISLDQLNGIYVSDSCGNLVQTNFRSSKLCEIRTSVECGHHTVTSNANLIFTEREKKVIYRIIENNDIAEFLKTGDWTPFSIYSSHINGDLLVGMAKVKEAKLTRYNKSGKELQNIQRDTKGRDLFALPHYITENINGDICISEHKKAVVVVNKSGQHRFSYTGQGSAFCPYGICTDVLGHILVCDDKSRTVHLLDKGGQFLSLLLSQQHGVDYPRSVCVDDENNLYVGQWLTNILTVYKYLQ
ncbi:uncharacterized protein LOC134279839 [Saccostrea cucullata]|uniref:uncharacterized protein LOC134266960 n=1 Tax=Saccostrea cuccullata TaxID=36930 RepID=UPI002ED0A74B